MIRTNHTFLRLALALPLAAPFLGACSGGSSSGGGGDAVQLRIQNIAVEAGVTAAEITFESNQVATATIEWGTSTAYGSQLSAGGSSASHVVQLAGLLPATSYHFRVIVQTSAGSSRTSANQVFVTGTPGSFLSDDFSAANIDLARWSLRNPGGGASVRVVDTDVSDGKLELRVPDGAEYLPWLTNGAARLNQTVANDDLDLEVQFIGGPTVEGTGQGLIFEQDSDDFVRFDFAYNGGQVQLFAASFVSGALDQISNTAINSGPFAPGTTLFLRVTRSGDDWLQRWSTDGANWNNGAAFSFELDVNQAGVFLANSGAPASAAVCVVDSLFDFGAPIAPEDGATPDDTSAPFLHALGALALSDDQVRLSWASDEFATTSIRWGLDTNYAGGSYDDVLQAYTGSYDVSGLDADTDYHFQVTLTDALNQSTESADLLVRTLPDGTIGAPTIDVWYSETLVGDESRLVFGLNGDPQPQVNVLGDIDDGDEGHLKSFVTLHYRYPGGPWIQLELGDDRTISYAPWRLANEGNFNLELYVADLELAPLVNGFHRTELELVAQDDDSHVTYRTVYVDYAAGNDWSATTSVDWDAALIAGQDVEDVAQVLDGKWFIEDHPTLGAGLRMDDQHMGYDRLVAIGEGLGSGAWENYEATMTATVLALDPQGYTDGTSSYAFGFGMRWTGHTAGWAFSQPNHNIYPLGGLFVYRWFDAFTENWELWVNKDEEIITLAGNPVALGTTYVYKLRCETQFGGGTRYRLKMWQEGTTEPGAWSYDYTTSATDDQPNGSLLLVAHHVDCHIGDITVTELP